MSLRKQQGFTLIEIAIVLVIIGLLLGGILQGQSLINSARVRNLISQVDGVKAAFYGFQDRYRALPGDFSQADTLIPGETAGVTFNGDGDGQIKPPEESVAVWDHLSHAGFITGSYVYVRGAAADSDTSTPKNAWNAYIQLIYDSEYVGTPTPRHNLKTGKQVPVEVLAEVDRKIDDGKATTGIMRFSGYPITDTTHPVDDSCYDTATSGATAGVWKAGSGEANCGAAILF